MFENTIQIPTFTDAEIEKIVANSDPAEMALLALGEKVITCPELAKLIHIKDDYGNKPYWLHLSDVAQHVDEPYKDLAWLHDAYEDHPRAWYMIRMFLPPKLIPDVLAISRQNDESYKDYIQRIKASGNQAVIAVKIADLQSNLRHKPKASLQERYNEALSILQAQ